MGRSIRWTLIGWYGLLLTLVLCTFGTVLYRRAAATALAGVDVALEERARAIAAALEWDERDGWELELSDEYLRGLASGSHWCVFGPDGSLVRASGAEGPAAPSFSAGVRERGRLRELEIAGPRGARILVGRSVAPERARLDALLASVALAGAAVLALALAGGAWLARRSLAPVARLASDAAAIGERELAERLDEQAAPQEIRGLARAFNGILERLQAAFERQARFTADASHELRTPLAIVRAQAEQALRRPRTDEEYRAALAACARAAERMSDLVAALLALARADAGEDPRRRERIDLAALVGESVEAFRPAAAAAQVELSCELEPASVLGDARLLARGIENLLDNGLRYNRPGGRVDVSLCCADGRARLRVADTGSGIAPEALPHLFERFYRADPSRSRAREGSGLGLAIARAVIETHGGSIAVESELGAGSAFTVELPAEGGTPHRGRAGDSA